MVKEVRGSSFPAGVRPAEARYEGEIATVRVGEWSLAKIAKRLRASREALLQANPQLSDPENLKPGQEIRLVARAKGLEPPQLEDATVLPESSDQGKLAEQSLDGLLRSLEFKAAPDGSSGAASVKQKSGGAAPARMKFVGMVLGQNQQNQEVRVKREVGAPEGYDDRLQAIAVARLGRAEPSVVVRNPNTGKWHALETTAGFPAGPVSAATPQGLTVVGMPSSADISRLSSRVTSLKERLAELDAAKKKGSDPERDQVIKDLKDAYLKLASATFGVPESEIQFNASSTGRTAGKINITAQDNRQSIGRHGPAGGDKGEGFQPGQVTAFEVDLADLVANPTGSQVTLFHEVAHMNHHELAQEWVKNYTGETKRMFVNNPPQAMKYFEDWIKAQAPKRLTKAEAELIVDVAANRNGTTEALANVHSFLAALQAGAPDQATKELEKYAAALPPGKQYASPPPKSEVLAALTKELQAAYRQMPKAMQDQFDAAMQAAQKANSSAWISNLKFSK